MARRARAGLALVARHLGLAARRRLQRVPMAGISDEFGFTFGRHGWHPFVALLDQTVDDEAVPITDFERFFGSPAVNAVRNLNEVLDLSAQPLGLTARCPFWLGTYPWGGLAAADHDEAGPAFGWAYDEATGSSTADLWGPDRTVWYRPDRRPTLANERRLTLDLRRSIRKGYRPLRARGFPRLLLLRRSNGETQSVVIDGHHRLAVLAHLGVGSVLAEIDGVVDERNVADWYRVRTGDCSADDALAVFDAFFVLDGTERVRHVFGRSVVTP
ncbi:MAG: hypothetical protein OEZ14_03110 [Acidimicrobiia bacterium]|nr:hypothetical protein [Acidimicrobiia bacterium]MDH5519504.1 hypothetical protein [Acidimicrobiia bacterium]